MGKTLVRSPGPIVAGEGHKDSQADRKNSGLTSTSSRRLNVLTGDPCKRLRSPNGSAFSG